MANYWRREAELMGQIIVDGLDEPERWEACAMSCDGKKFMHIYDKVECTTKLTLETSGTWYDLYKAAQFAVNAHTMMVRGF